MKKRQTVILTLVLTLGFLASAAMLWRQATIESGTASEPAAQVDGPVVAVKVHPLRRGDIEETLTAYGSVAAEPGKSVSLSVPYESSVVRMLVVPGQSVKTGDAVVEVAPSTATRLQIKQAKATLDNAQIELKQTTQRYDLKLATNQELNLARKTVDDASLVLRSLMNEGVESNAPLESPVDGIVTTLGAQAGQIVPAGGILAEVVAADAIEVRLGVEPEDLDALAAGANLTLFPVNQPGAGGVPGRVRLVAGSVNPATRLVDAFAALPAESRFLLGGYVRAEFVRQVTDVLLVPASALLLGPDDLRIFTVRDGKAIGHTVKVGVRNKDEAEVHGEGLAPGADVVIEGNYELEDGMRLEVHR
jgi:RND family efflux transporter MFP subunit